MNKDIIQVVCNDCGVLFQTLHTKLGDRYGYVCAECSVRSDEYRRKVNGQQLREKEWLAQCPPVFQDTQFNLLPLPEVSRRALQWPYMISGCPEKSVQERGLNLWGFPRTGKTRTLYLVMKAAHFGGLTFRVLGPSEFAQQCEVRQFKTAGFIKSLVAYDILAFDDIDKCKMPLHCEEKLFAVLDERFRNKKPVFFTGNSRGDQLRFYFKNGEAIVGRIREHCISIYFPQPKDQK